MTWVTEKVAVVEAPTEHGVVRAAQVTGLTHTRSECGCQARVGIRLDNGEATLGVVPCADHDAANIRALQIVQTMPPSDNDMLTLLGRTARGELAKDQAAV